MDVIIIAAVAANRVIGKDNDLVWHLPDDMRFFKESTKGYPVIMGRKNYESIPLKFRPLPDRLNIILSRDPLYMLSKAIVLSDLEQAIEIAEEEEKDKAFIIGGAQIYSLALDLELVDEMLITEVDAQVEGDAFFPEYNAAEWDKVLIQHHPIDDHHEYAFSIYRLRKKV